MNAAPKLPDTWAGLLYDIMRKQGVWAGMFVAVVACIGYELHWGVRTVGAAVTEYVAQSGEGVKKLNEAVKLLAVTLEATQRSTVTNGELLNGVSKTHELQCQQLDKTIQLIEAAHQTMKDAPARGEKMLQLTQEVTESMKEQAVVLKEIRDKS